MLPLWILNLEGRERQCQIQLMAGDVETLSKLLPESELYKWLNDERIRPPITTEQLRAFLGELQQLDLTSLETKTYPRSGLHPEFGMGTPRSLVSTMVKELSSWVV